MIGVKYFAREILKMLFTLQECAFEGWCAGRNGPKVHCVALVGARSGGHLVNAAEKSRGKMFLKTDSFLFLVPGQFFVFFHPV